MFKIYLKQTWRSLVRSKMYSLLNIVGLSASITCFALIALWVNDELRYDKFNSNYDRIFRLVSTATTETGVEESAVSSAPMAAALKNDYAEVADAVRLKMREEIVTHKNQQVLQPGILLTDPSFFNVFSYALTQGNVATALNEPYSIILTQATAKKYFGDEDPMGQTLLINMFDSTGQGALYKVTGIMPDPPKNAHFTFNVLASFKTIEVAKPDILTVDGWGDAGFYTYVLLKRGVDYKNFSNKITQFYGKYIGELYNIWRSIYFYRLQPLGDIHLHSKLQHEIAPNGSIIQVYIFSTIGFFILLLASINYMNLATARSAGRAKEVGIKKVVGAAKKQLIAQYLFEAVLTAIIALVLSLASSVLLQPFFYQITGKDLYLFSSPLLLVALLGLTLFLGLLSGVYPAFIISAFKPVSVLKGPFKSGHKAASLRKALVVSQFVITMVLVTGIVVIYSQMSFIKHKDLGFDKDALLFLRVNGNADVIDGYAAFKNELQASPLVSGMTTSNSLIGDGLGTGGAETVNSKGNPLQVSTSRLRVDDRYFDIYGIRLLAGRNFMPDGNDAIQQIVVNETAAKRFGWGKPENAIGKPFKIGDQAGVVVGVTKDFHFNSLQQEIEPLAIYPLENHFSRITLKIDIKKADLVIALIERTWKKHFPAALFDYDFLSQQIGAQYRSEERFSKIFLYFSVLALLIACLGLYGLISYTTFQKTKEIGIRKVLGATTQSIAIMLSGDFFKLVLLACLISMPIAWYEMNNWLQNFAYRIHITWWMFAAAGILVLLIAWLTVSFQAIKAALANPVKSLRTE